MGGQKYQSGVKPKWHWPSLRMVTLPLLVVFILLLTYLEKRSADSAFQKIVSLWENEVANALLSGDRSFGDKLSKSIATGNVERIEITTPQGAFASYPHTLAPSACLLPVSHSIDRYGISLGTMAGCLSFQAIIRNVLFSPFLIVFLAFWFVLIEFARVARQEAKAKLRSAKQFSQLARQVAHDIRSPLAALDSVSQSLKDLPEKNRLLILMAIERIHGIANTLLESYRNPKPNAPAQVSVQSLSLLAQSLILEKKSQFESQTGKQIHLDLEASSDGAFAKVDPVAFKSVLSNLVNNSVEHLKKRGSVIVKLKKVDAVIEVSVNDNGRGIPKEILSKLTNEEVTTKADGNGIGLLNARRTVESWGGTIEIQSTQSFGTSVTLRIPTAKVSTQPDLILIDDNPLGLMAWENAAEEDGKRIRAFSSFEEFVTEMNQFDKKTPIYLDWDLGDNVTSGMEAGEIISQKGFETIYITTGYEPETIPSLPWVKKIMGKQPPRKKGQDD